MNFHLLRTPNTIYKRPQWYNTIKIQLFNGENTIITTAVRHSCVTFGDDLYPKQNHCYIV